MAGQLSDSKDAGAISGLKKESCILQIERCVRLEVEERRSAFVQLQSGSAEILGTRLESLRLYEFPPGSKLVVSSWLGCTLNFYGMFYSISLTTSSTMTRNLSLHGCLNQMRSLAQSRSSRGPRVLVAGPTDVGKSSLCRTLLNYAVRSGWSPMFVDLDVGQNEISIPGTIGALPMTEQSDVVRGHVAHPFKVNHFGQKSPGENMRHYEILIDEMAKSIDEFQKQNETSNVSGIIINTCGWVIGQGYLSILRAAYAFEVDLVVVIGQEPLCLSLASDLPDFVKILPIPIPTEVAVRTRSERMWKRNSVIRNYFYGDDDVTPLESEISFEDVKIFWIGNKLDNNKRLKVVNVDIGVDLERHVASVIDDDVKECDLVHAGVADFVVILEVNVEDRRLRILSKSPITYPKNLLLMDGITYNV